MKRAVKAATLSTTHDPYHPTNNRYLSVSSLAKSIQFYNNPHFWSHNDYSALFLRQHVYYIRSSSGKNNCFNH